MLTLTSSEAERDFAKALDASEREPVIIIRQGHPASILVSPGGDPQSAFLQLMRAARVLAPLEGPDALREFDRIVAGQTDLSNGLTEDEITTWVHESR